jgi:hypothetical protein
LLGVEVGANPLASVIELPLTDATEAPGGTASAASDDMPPLTITPSPTPNGAWGIVTSVRTTPVIVALLAVTPP